MKTSKSPTDAPTGIYASPILTEFPKLTQRAEIFVRDRLVGTIAITIVGSLLLTGMSSINIWTVYQGLQSKISRQFKLQKSSSEIKHLDELLTMSARMAASTGDIQWQKRYQEFAPKLDREIAITLKNVTPDILNEANKTKDAHTRIVQIETQAFNLVRQGKSPMALSLLLGNEYNAQKQIYTEGNERVWTALDLLIQQELKSYQQQLFISIAFAAIALPILLGSWGLLLSAVRDYIRDRQASQTALQTSQANLLDLNEHLRSEVEIRKQQEESIRQESEQLQQDISKLLDIVSAIEEGDLTVQAPVNSRSTGLIGDTLNRLVEELGTTLSQVKHTAQRVSANSERQKKMAEIVAVETTKQAQSITQVISLTATVRQSAQNAANQLAATNESLLMVQAAISTGEITVESLDREIDVLRTGSDRIVQQMKTLGEFVGLADRFVQDQGEIATQTQVLALNASLVASRAVEQRDPQQFAIVAREFESIASQVSQLAEQTNDGLTGLEQQSHQIQKVVSDVDVQVQRLGGLVDALIQGVKETREVFSTVQSVAVATVDSAEMVATTSEEIVCAVDATVTAVDEIAQIAHKIAQQSQAAQSVADRVNNFSVELLQKIEVFQLPVATQSEPTAASPEIVNPAVNRLVALELN
jgi:twitching motility protein PilJ